MGSSPPSLAQQYRDLAADGFAAAQCLTDPDERLLMLMIAAGYQELATRAQQREQAEAPLPLADTLTTATE